MNEKPQNLKKRLVDYSLRGIRLYTALPKNDRVAMVLGDQALRSGTSVKTAKTHKEKQ
jgi:hypothetical protein